MGKTQKNTTEKASSSPLATFLEITGAVTMYWGVKSLFTPATLEIGIVLTVIGVGCIALGDYVRKRKNKQATEEAAKNITTDAAKDAAKDAAFEAWWNEIKAAGLEPQIAQSQSVAVQVFKKNPQQRTLEKIKRLNPSAAAYIEQKAKKH